MLFYMDMYGEKNSHREVEQCVPTCDFGKKKVDVSSKKKKKVTDKTALQANACHPQDVDSIRKSRWFTKRESAGHVAAKDSLKSQTVTRSSDSSAVTVSLQHW